MPRPYELETFTNEDVEYAAAYMAEYCNESEPCAFEVATLYPIETALRFEESNDE